ncbi:MAG: hypothetical protein WCG77_11730 [Actinomycetes bacterium]
MSRPEQAPDQPAANDPQYRDAMQRYEKCPVCGRGEQNAQPGARDIVSHLDCAKKLEAELTALKDSFKHLHSRWDYTQYWFANLYPVDWDRCQEKYNTTKTGAREEADDE